MSRFLGSITLIMFVMSLALTGCNRGVTEIETIPEPPPPQRQPEPEPPPPPPPPPPVDVGALLRGVLNPVYFDFDKADLTPETIRTLERIASLMREHSQIRLRAEGHTDERGSSQYNMGLGENRARSIRDYFASYGISADRIEITSYGKEKPVRTNCGADDDCHGRNRRVEWTILAK
ncbi:Peptidoglycan-associated lipoprotein [Chitinispirillum alkaliphilum]|nr:Peptidoglycan-associated lipoprotein [Chitinispirillum alkaliphilum]